MLNFYWLPDSCPPQIFLNRGVYDVPKRPRIGTYCPLFQSLKINLKFPLFSFRRRILSRLLRDLPSFSRSNNSSSYSSSNIKRTHYKFCIFGKDTRWNPQSRIIALDNDEILQSSLEADSLLVLLDWIVLGGRTWDEGVGEKNPSHMSLPPYNISVVWYTVCFTMKLMG